MKITKMIIRVKFEQTHTHRKESLRVTIFQEIWEFTLAIIYVKKVKNEVSLKPKTLKFFEIQPR